jgi:putative nucleotide binding protein
MSISARRYGERGLEDRDLDYEAPARRMYEEYAYVLDYLPTGRQYQDRHRHIAAPTVQVIGEDYLTLLELELRFGVTVTLHERLYVGKDKRDKVERIVGRIGYDELTATAKVELPVMLEELIRKRESHFVDFFNRAQPMTPRMHALELLPGIGKKSMWHIVDTREKKPFESFSDIQARAGIPDPTKTIARRIIEELTGESKYRLFIRAT